MNSTIRNHENIKRDENSRQKFLGTEKKLLYLPPDGQHTADRFSPVTVVYQRLYIEIILSFNVIVLKMQREEKQLEAALDALLQRINDLKTSIRTLLFRLENEYGTLSWPSVLDSYAVISGQVNSINKCISCLQNL